MILENAVEILVGKRRCDFDSKCRVEGRMDNAATSYFDTFQTAFSAHVSIYG
jgi:hypothetical protein